MEVYSRSSWFLLLLGAALVAATLNESPDCPTADKVSCVNGIKCDSNDDCQNSEICCQSPCYTKRCITNPKGVQGAADTDGPSESDCRPYIEKALKELEIGEVAQSDEKDESIEDVPTVEITDDSSHQEAETGDQGDESDETETENETNAQSVEEDETQQEAPLDATSDEDVEAEVEADADAEATPEEPTLNESPEETEAEESTKNEEPEVAAEEAAAELLEEVPVEAELVQEAADVPELAEESQEGSVVVPGSPEEESKEEEKSAEQPEEVNVVEEDGESQEDEAKSVEEGGKSAEDEASTEEAKSVEKEEEQAEEPTQEASEEKSSVEAPESAEEEENVDGKEIVDEPEQAAESSESTEQIGCPAVEQVSCTEGTLCIKHKNCGENEICCPNKCYRKRCVPGVVPQEELDAESESDESEPDAKSEEQAAPSTPETGCPSPNDVSCHEGTLCSKHKQCGEDEICCPNKCYRKRCVPGTATSAELAEESDEDSEESAEAPSEQKPVESRTETGCPESITLACQGGEFCTKHKECGDEEICCPNKCYRKICTPGTATEAELALEESDEASEEQAAESQLQSIKPKESGCHDREDIPCAGTPCTKNKNCDDGQICCSNKCYRKVCVPGTPGSDEEDEESEEEVAEPESQVESKEESAEDDDSDCPRPENVPCKDGQRCGDDDDCEDSEICCPNKCYTRKCVPGPRKEEESAEELQRERREEPRVEVKEQAAEKPVSPPPKSVVPPTKPVTPPVVPSIKPVTKPAEPITPPTKPAAAQVKPVKPPPAPKPVVQQERPKLVIDIPAPEPIVPAPEESVEQEQEPLVEELTLDTDIPTELRSRDHVEHLLKLDRDSSQIEGVQNKVYEETLKELKKVYDNAIKPLEVLYKYRDLSNRHFGDAEIFSKPLILFMGPWSGGKSSIINYLLNNEYNDTSLHTGAEPSPAYFNILMHGEEAEIIDGTELAADFTFSGLQKFGQGLEERLRGVKLPVKLLERVNIVEIPGILEVRKQVSRVFPFNDACQWFIDRADIIFLVYDPAKLDVGPETEAILDQLKGREHQTRIILNKADHVKPEELMRVQGALIWNISPLMSSPQPPVMYTTSLWSRPYEPWAPTRLLQAQERAFLRDLRTAVDRRVENKIASARRFAVRVRNHAKMVDCYLTTYYNHKSVFGNRKQVANEIIEHPQNYHIYEGLSTLTNISRYDLPDPDVYRDFFKLNPLYEFQQLSATCTYFRGCPINRLDIAIAYDLPELVGTYKRNLEEALVASTKAPEPPQRSKKSAPGS
ncbi:hypothetical protein GWI33_018371 [Rhynchophorus ferrugineus]|uniref:WAP domain-containing protein n=1 Tax=Rhynchophorus ferrugineus TaxID=354439 RepID=A0A834HTI5_RHYFE|nr:hypothetical protein GWI33_018371 [Rhynchophorus ferrugineus]